MASILIIDDEPSIRTLIRDALESEHTLTEAANGAEGMRHFAVTPFDLVITDIVMPVQEGIETLLHIRRLKPEQKVIVVSGGLRMGAGEFLKLTENIGVDALLKKPFSPGTLRATVQACLKGD